MHHKITPAHLARKAIVYLRQSSPQQVRRNLESQHLQYDLVRYAKELGWSTVEVIDTDLGFSASAGSQVRVGFQRLLSEVATRQVGIIFSREASRLSRNDKDWCALLELCQLFDTLLGDAEQIYDLQLTDDQLVLGIKGTLSVVELRTLRLRLQQGMENKARRGELIRLLPPGFVRDRDGQVCKDPDLRVQELLALVFRKFRETWSIRQTMCWFHQQEVALPVNKFLDGAHRLAWQLPTYSFVSDVLHNPCYAGAYVYGRRITEVALVEGRPVKRQGRTRPAEAARVLLRDHHEGYITWAMYEEHQRRMRGNALRLNQAGEELVGAVRAGHGLLAGLLRCRRCGRKLQVRYWGKAGTAARYLCAGDFDQGGRYCLGFGGATVDRNIGEQVVAAISPLGVAASLEAQRRLEQVDEDAHAALERRRELAAYEALRAAEQYHAVDPRHRQVAAELERRWNEKLEQRERCEAALRALAEQRSTPSVADRAQLVALGADFAAVWANAACPMELKKQIVRTVIEEVLVDWDEASDRLQFLIHWQGGCHTAFAMDKPRSGVGRRTAQADLEIITLMAGRGYGDDEIARVLNKLGRRTGHDKRYNQERVATARRNHAIAGQRRARRDPERLSLGEAVKQYGVSDTTFRRLVERGLLPMTQVAPWAPWELRRSDLDAEPVHGILQHLKQTGKLVLDPVTLAVQRNLF